MEIQRQGWAFDESAYAPVPWWAWNGKLEYNQICRQLDQMRSGGITEFFIYATSGLEEPEFLSAAWFDFVGFTIREAARRGMRIWLYDDLNWPSGTAGGRLMRDYPEYRLRPLVKQTVLANPGCAVFFDLAEAPLWCGAFDDRGDIGKIELDGDFSFMNRSASPLEVVVITPQYTNGIDRNSTGADGTWNQHGYIDLLNPNAVSAWMGFIHEQYRARFREFFGTVVKGFFYDEPSLWSEGAWAPWTPQLPQWFRERYDYDLVPHLEAIFYDVPGAERIRYDYWRLVSERMGEAFAGQIARWCAENHLISTGHGTPEEPKFQMQMLRGTGELQDQIKYNQMPGVDLLGDVTCFDDRPSPWNYGSEPGWTRNLASTVKRGASIARYSGAKRVMCETFGVLPWRSSLQNQRRLVAFLAGMGINFINDNSLQYTIEGFRKYFASGKHFTQPFWSRYADFSRYCSRLSSFAVFGKCDTEIAVLYPTTTNMCRTRVVSATWNLTPESTTAEPLNRVTDALLRNHRDFELIFDRIILESEVRNGALHTPGGNFTTVIVPGAPVLDERVVSRLAALQASGGRVISVGVPAGTLLMTEAGGFRTAENAAGLHLEIDEAFSGKLEAVLKPPVFELSGAGAETVLTSLRRDESGKRLLLLANLAENTAEFDISTSIIGEIAVHHPDDGGVCRLDSNHFRLMSGESMILEFDRTGATELPPVSESLLSGRRILGKSGTPEWKIRLLSPNLFQPEREIAFDPHGMLAPDYDAPAAWMPVSRMGWFEAGVTPEESPYYLIRGEFAVSEPVPEDIAFIVDSAELLDAFTVNGKPAVSMDRFELWDQANLRLPIAPLVQPGGNRFCARFKTSKWFAQRYMLVQENPLTNRLLDPLVLAGQFLAGRDGISALPETLNSGRISGLELFTGKMELSTSFDRVAADGFEVDFSPPRERDQSSLCALSDRVSHLVMTAELNDVPLGARCWSPYRFSVPEKTLLPSGNQLKLVIGNTLGALLPRSLYVRTLRPEFVLPREIAWLKK